MPCPEELLHILMEHPFYSRCMPMVRPGGHSAPWRGFDDQLEGIRLAPMVETGWTSAGWAW